MGACFACPSTQSREYLRPAAIEAGVRLEKGQRFGLHNLRHSLATWLASIDKSDIKTVQGVLRHADANTTLNLYAKTVPAQAIEAQGRFIEAMGMGKGTRFLEAVQ